MQVIGERSSILRKDNLFSLVILPTVEKRKVSLMFIWLLLWTVGGFIILVNYFKLTQQSARLFVIIWLGFWAYFEFKIIRVFLWKRFGKEKLWIKDGVLFYQREVSGKGKTREYDLNLISDISLIELSKGNFVDVFNQTFWVKGGERLEFTYQYKQVRFGMQLSDAEAKSILKDLKQFLRERR